MLLCCCSLAEPQTCVQKPMNIPAQETKSSRPLTELVNEDELKGNVERWRYAKQGFYTSYFDKVVSIQIDGEGSKFIVSQYAGRKLGPTFFENRTLARAVIRLDLNTVMDRSFLESVEEQYQTIAGFITSPEAKLLITVGNIKSAIAKEDCKIIPCPAKCKKDCSEQTFKRYTEVGGAWFQPCPDGIAEP